MTVQSSFLIRCTLHLPGQENLRAGDPATGKPFYIQHVQTGAEFRSATLDELTRWAAEQNVRYQATVIGASTQGVAQEDLV